MMATLRALAACSFIFLGPCLPTGDDTSNCVIPTHSVCCAWSGTGWQTTANEFYCWAPSEQNCKTQFPGGVVVTNSAQCCNAGSQYSCNVH